MLKINVLNLKIKMQSYAKLMRLHRPIGIFLLLWPIWWSLWLAANDLPPVKILAIFTVGVILMRSAGCIINDIADQKFDGNVARTKDRPLVIGLITRTQAFIAFFILCLIAFILVLQLNWFTIGLSFVALGLSVIYPLTKRFIYFPQVILGIAWYIGILMAFTAINGHINLTGWLLYLTCILWAVIYDTMYAMVDRQDDIAIGVKSTAILFAQYDKLIIAILQMIVILLLLGIGYLNHLRWPFYVGISATMIFFIYQQYLIKDRIPERCLDAFVNNHWVGVCIFLGIFFNSI